MVGAGSGSVAAGQNSRSQGSALKHVEYLSRENVRRGISNTLTTNFSCTPTLYTTHASMQHACPSDSPAGF